MKMMAFDGDDIVDNDDHFALFGCRGLIAVYTTLYNEHGEMIMNVISNNRNNNNNNTNCVQLNE